MILRLHDAATGFGVEALVSVCLTVLLCTLVVLSVTLCSDVDKRRAASRDCAFFILHGVSTLFSFGVVFESFSHYERNERRICWFMAFLVDTTWVVVRISVFNIYSVRLNDLTQKNIFGPAVRYVCWSAMLVGTIPLFAAGIVEAEIGAKGTCEHTPKTPMLELAALTQVIPCLIYIVLFTIPFFKYPIGAWKGPEGFHLAVVIFDALIDIGTMVIVFFVKSRRQCVVIYLANVILSNVLLVFIFSDWRLRLLPCKNRRISEVPEGRSLLTSMDFQDRLYPVIKSEWEIGVRISDIIEK